MAFSLSSLYSERERLILWLPVWLALGISFYFALPQEPDFAWILAGCAVAVLALVASWRHYTLRLVTGAVCVVLLGMVTASLRTQAVATPVIYGELFFRTVEGHVDEVETREKNTRLTLSQVTVERLPPERMPRRMTVTLRKVAEPLQVGDRVQLKAMLFEPPTPAMPGAFDFSRMSYFESIGAVGFAPGAPIVLSRQGTSGFSEWLTDLRASLAQRIGAVMEPQSGAVAAALMVGEMAGVSEETREVMRDAGIYHVLSISGLHMTLAAGLIFLLTRLLLSLYPPLALRLPVKKMAAVVGLLGAFAYVLLAGYPVPAVRSFVMVACVMLAILCDRQGISLYSLAWAATIVLLLWPEALLGVSFQLSFAATVAIVALYERYGHKLSYSQRGVLRTLGVYALGVTLTSLVATLATAPLVIYHFNRFTLWGLLANLVMMPLASFWIMPAAVLAFIALPFGLEYWPLQWLGSGIGWMMEGARWVAGLANASLVMPPPTFWGLLLVVMGGLWLCLWKTSLRFAAIPLIVIGMSSALLYKPYDILISDNAKKVAVRLESGEYLFLRGKPDSYDAQLWMRAEGDDLALSRKEARKTRNDLVCSKYDCTLSWKGKTIIAAIRKGDTESLCARNADIVISAEEIDKTACPATPLVIDRAYLQPRGAIGIRLKEGSWVVDDSASKRGKRPWVGGMHSRLYQSANTTITSP
ncbi:MAG: ComEC/Rec2 family competence protein [Rickettsiales bacterium]|nr:ComEC/Rec2 family competence protein [Rickettsiales bacterium]